MDSKANARRAILICVLLAGVTLIAYLPLFKNDFVQYDDREYVLENPHVNNGLSSLAIKWAFQANYSSNWHPLTWISHMLDVQLFGLKPLGHHIVSLLFHAANTLLLFLLFQFTTGAVWRSAFVAALFAVHPLHVESVAWVAERKDVLSTFFGLLCLLAYAKYAVSGEWRGSGGKQDIGTTRLRDKRTAEKAETKPGDRKEAKNFPSLQPSPQGGGSPQPTAPSSISKLPSPIFYLLSLLFLALGLMSKPMLVTWPFVMLLLDFWPLRRARVGELRLESSDQRRVSISRLITEKFPFFALSLASCVVTFIAQHHGHSVAPTDRSE